MTWRIRDRATFEQIRRRGRRVRSGPIWISFVPDEPDSPSTPPRVACAFGRRTGNAVTRNLLRRRARAIIGQAHASSSIPPGAYLVGGSADAAELDFPQLQHHVTRALGQLDAKSGSSRGGPA